MGSSARLAPENPFELRAASAPSRRAQMASPNPRSAPRDPRSISSPCTGNRVTAGSPEIPWVIEALRVGAKRFPVSCQDGVAFSPPLDPTGAIPTSSAHRTIWWHDRAHGDGLVACMSVLSAPLGSRREPDVRLRARRQEVDLVVAIQMQTSPDDSLQKALDQTPAQASS